MKHLDTYKLFEKYHLPSADIHPEIKKFVTDNIGWNDGIKHCVGVASRKAFELIRAGHTRPTVIIKSGENVLFKNMIEFYFGKNLPKIIDDSKWDLYTDKWKTYWRGVENKKYIDDLMYFGNFSGGNNMYQGTWITDDIDYAKKYHNEKEPETLLQILLNPAANIAEEKDIDILLNKVRDNLFVLESDTLNANDFDRYLYNTIKYLSEYLIQPTILCLVNGYDGIRMDGVYAPKNKDREVLVVFNKEKLALKK